MHVAAFQLSARARDRQVDAYDAFRRGRLQMRSCVESGIEGVVVRYPFSHEVPDARERC
jgi:hypothetical protein